MANKKAVKIGDKGILPSSGIAIGGSGIAVTSVLLTGIWWNLVMAPFWNDVMITYWNIAMDEEI